MSASRLREAAELLRTRAEAAAGDDWRVVGADAKAISPGLFSSAVIGWTVARSDAAYIAMMSPPVALALADWLDKYADIQPQARHVSRPAYSDLAQALALADAILGSPTTDTTTNEGRDE